MKKFTLVAVPLLLAVVVVAYVFLAGSPEEPNAPAVSAPAQEAASSGGLPDAETVGGADKDGRSTKLAENEFPPRRRSDKTGALTQFSISYGEIGYVDVDSVVRDRDPYSVVALLQAHHDLTGADESLEIMIDWAGENEVWGYEARFVQLIEGQPTNEVGTILFSSSGAVGRMHGDIVNTEALSSGSMVILQAEAEAIAREAAVRYAASLPEMPDSRGQPLTIEILPGELQYRLDSKNDLHRVWWIPVEISGRKWDTAQVLISSETGKVTQVGSVRVRQVAATQRYPCDDITFRVCNAEGTRQNSCAGVAAPLEAKHETVMGTASSVISDVDTMSSEHIQRKPGLRCTIDVIMESPLSGAYGEYDPAHDVIRIDEDTSQSRFKSTIAHEVFHALTKTSFDTDVEEGLVYAMEALYLEGVEEGGDENHWTAGGGSVDFTVDYRFQGTFVVYKSVANAIYRVFQKVDRDKALEFALRVDSQRPTSHIDFQRKMVEIGNNMLILRDVIEVLLAMGGHQAIDDYWMEIYLSDVGDGFPSPWPGPFGGDSTGPQDD